MNFKTIFSILAIFGLSALSFLLYSDLTGFKNGLSDAKNDLSDTKIALAMADIRIKALNQESQKAAKDWDNKRENLEFRHMRTISEKENAEARLGARLLAQRMQGFVLRSRRLKDAADFLNATLPLITSNFEQRFSDRVWTAILELHESDARFALAEFLSTMTTTFHQRVTEGDALRITSGQQGILRPAAFEEWLNLRGPEWLGAAKTTEDAARIISNSLEYYGLNYGFLAEIMEYYLVDNVGYLPEGFWDEATFEEAYLEMLEGEEADRVDFYFREVKGIILEELQLEWERRGRVEKDIEAEKEGADNAADRYIAYSIFERQFKNDFVKGDTAKVAQALYTAGITEINIYARNPRNGSFGVSVSMRVALQWAKRWMSGRDISLLMGYIDPTKNFWIGQYKLEVID